MPIYEFSCTQCGAVFEELVRNGTKPVCPECSSGEVCRLLSRFAVHSSSPGLGGTGGSKSCSTCSSSSCATCH
jgi:putative FmdB family regulatory protein